MEDDYKIIKPGHNWQLPTGHLKNQINRGEILSQSIASNTGYLNLVFSPAASENPKAENKLAIACLFQEWKSLGKLIQTESAILGSSFYNHRLVNFILEAIDSIPDPDQDRAVKLERAVETEEYYEEDQGGKYRCI